MLIAYPALGILAGAAGAVFALVAGAGIWVALASYILGGLVGVIAVVFWTLVTPSPIVEERSPVAERN